MLLFKGHGTTIVGRGDVSLYGERKAMTAEDACGYLPGTYPTAPQFGKFDYLFKQADGLDPDGAIVTPKLDALADATIGHDPSMKEDSEIPPIFTYMGQFIDHDLTANTDREGGLSVIDKDVVTPEDRGRIADEHVNLRFASLNLDSLYGDAPNQGPISRMLQDNLRWHGDRALMEGGIDNDATHFPAFDPGQAADPELAALPRDGMRDLLRFGHASGHANMDLNLLRNASEEVRKMFFGADGSIIPRRAIIGDNRNDENLAVAQFHLAMLRLHNAVAQSAPEDVRSQGRDAVFSWAQGLTRWIYQWLVVNAYLPAVCDRDILGEVEANGPKLYNGFLQRLGHPSQNTDLLPMPLEFSVAAYRFGHSMARGAYDWNRIFGRRPDGTRNDATFRLLFAFTGNGGMFGSSRLPGNWPIAWDRFVHAPSSAMPDRSALKIDTFLNTDLGHMQNEEPGTHGVLRHLARRNLRRGYRLNLPNAQGCLDALRDDHGINLTRLTAAELTSGHTGAAVRDGQFETATPLWFYVLKEAEILAGGQHLGPLGSLIVADTITGLVRHTPNGYWTHPDAGPRWTPSDSVQPGGVSISDMPSMMQAAGLL